MRLKGFHNNYFTNLLIKWAVIGGDFVVLWMALYWVVDYIPLSEEWEPYKMHTFWMVCTLAMMVSEYLWPTDIHLRMVGVREIARRTTLLMATQTILSYLVSRVLDFRAHLGWQLLFMGLAMLVVVTLIRIVEHQILKQLRKLGYNKRRVTLVGADPEIHRLHQKMMNNPSYGYSLRSSYVSTSDFSSLLSQPEGVRLGDELYLCVSCKERELIERTANLCQERMVKFYYVPTAEEKLNLQPVLFDDMELMTTPSGPLKQRLKRWMKNKKDKVLK